MDGILLKILDLSVVSSLLIVAVIVLRLVLIKAPKWIRYVMWIMVGLRLSIPFSIESHFSLVPKKEYISLPIMPLTQQISTTQQTPVAGENSITSALSYIWISVVGIFLLYMFISFLRIHFTVRESVLLKNNIYLCDHISNPFVLGILKPKIYLNSSISKKESRYIIAHEQMHIHHLDHIIKPIGFIILSVHWFNPLVWLAYFLFVKDIELFCDESVIKSLGKKGKQKYATVLLNCSTSNHILFACPLAFAENNVKNRVKNILSYKKPTFYVVGISVFLCVITIVLFMTNPVSAKEVEKVEIAPTQVATEAVTQPPTQQLTEKLTQKPTEKPTQTPTNPPVQQYDDSYSDTANNNDYVADSESSYITELEEGFKIQHEKTIQKSIEAFNGNGSYSNNRSNYIINNPKEIRIKNPTPGTDVIVWDVNVNPRSSGSQLSDYLSKKNISSQYLGYR